MHSVPKPPMRSARRSRTSGLLGSFGLLACCAYFVAPALAQTAQPSKSDYWFRLSGHVFGPTTAGIGTPPGGKTDSDGDGIPDDVDTDDDGDGTPDDEETTPPIDPQDAKSGPVRFLSVTQPTDPQLPSFSGRIELGGDILPASVTWDAAAAPESYTGHPAIPESTTTKTATDGGRTFSIGWSYPQVEFDADDNMVVRNMPCRSTMAIAPTSDPLGWTYAVSRAEGDPLRCGPIGPVGMKAVDTAGNEDRWTSEWIARIAPDGYSVLTVATRNFSFPDGSNAASGSFDVVPGGDPMDGVDVVFASKIASRTVSCGPGGTYVCVQSTSSAGKRHAVAIRDVSGRSTTVTFDVSKIDNGSWRMDLAKSGTLDLDWIESPDLVATASDGSKGFWSPGNLDFGVGETIERPVVVEPSTDDSPPTETIVGSGGGGGSFGPYERETIVKAKSQTLMARYFERFTNLEYGIRKDFDGEILSEGTSRYSRVGPARPQSGPSEAFYRILRENDPIEYDAAAIDDSGGWTELAPISGPDPEGYYTFDASYHIVRSSIADQHPPADGKCTFSFSWNGNLSVQPELSVPGGIPDPKNHVVLDPVRIAIAESTSGTMPCFY